MKYAVISDIHGNMPALSAVLGDARVYGVDHYLFVGDYYGDLPYPNEVVNKVRSLENVSIIRGNKEDYLQDLSGQDQTTWKYEHMMPLYWNYRELIGDNLNYLLNLPKELILHDGEAYIRMVHSAEQIVNSARIKELNSGKNIAKMKETLFTHKEYLDYARELLHTDEILISGMNNIPSGVYIFGHSHVQWHVRIGGSILLNPGSCGLPLDTNPCAAYTILENIDGEWLIDDRRIPYDVEAVVSGLKKSGLYDKSKIWCDITISQLRTGENIIYPFIKFTRQFANEINGKDLPYYSDEIWHMAADKWFGKRV